MDAYEKIVKYGQTKYQIEILFKDESLFMKILSFVLFFNPRFKTNYITTIGKKIYFPSKKWLEENRNSAAAVLAHEFVHVSDSIESGVSIFSYGYLFPQVLATLSICSVSGNLWWLLFLLFILPIPAPMRCYYELRGYAMSDAVSYKTTGEFLPIEFIEKQFLTSAYYYMWPFKYDIRNRILGNRELIKKGTLNQKIETSSEILKCFEK